MGIRELKEFWPLYPDWRGHLKDLLGVKKTPGAVV